MREDIYRMWDRVAEIEETAWSPNDYVTVTVGARSELRALVLDPRVYRDANADALAASILDTVTEASELARRRVLALLAPLLPPGATDPAFDPLTHHLQPGRH